MDVGIHLGVQPEGCVLWMDSGRERKGGEVRREAREGQGRGGRERMRYDQECYEV